MESFAGADLHRKVAQQRRRMKLFSLTNKSQAPAVRFCRCPENNKPQQPFFEWHSRTLYASSEFVTQRIVR